MKKIIIALSMIGMSAGIWGMDGHSPLDKFRNNQEAKYDPTRTVVLEETAQSEEERQESTAHVEHSSKWRAILDNGDSSSSLNIYPEEIRAKLREFKQCSDDLRQRGEEFQQKSTSAREGKTTSAELDAKIDEVTKTFREGCSNINASITNAINIAANVSLKLSKNQTSSDHQSTIKRALKVLEKNRAAITQQTSLLIAGTHTQKVLDDIAATKPSASSEKTPSTSFSNDELLAFNARNQKDWIEVFCKANKAITDLVERLEDDTLSSKTTAHAILIQYIKRLDAVHKTNNQIVADNRDKFSKALNVIKDQLKKIHADTLLMEKHRPSEFTQDYQNNVVAGTHRFINWMRKELNFDEVEKLMKTLEDSGAKLPSAPEIPSPKPEPAPAPTPGPTSSFLSKKTLIVGTVALICTAAIGIWKWHSNKNAALGAENAALAEAGG